VAVSRAASTLFCFPSTRIRGDFGSSFTSSIPILSDPSARLLDELLVGAGVGLSGPCTINPCPPMHQERRLVNIVSSSPCLYRSASENQCHVFHTRHLQKMISKFLHYFITSTMYTCNPSRILHTISARFKVRSSQNPSKNTSPIPFGLLIAGSLAILMRRAERRRVLDHRRSAQEDRNKCTGDVLARSQRLSSSGGWGDRRGSSSSGLGTRAVVVVIAVAVAVVIAARAGCLARSACAGCLSLSKFPTVTRVELGLPVDLLAETIVVLELLLLLLLLLLPSPLWSPLLVLVVWPAETVPAGREILAKLLWILEQSCDCPWTYWLIPLWY